jgi:hypothetical protein
MHKSLLIRKAAVSEWEAENMVDGLPFGGCNREWVAMLGKMEPGDEVWFWSTDEESWRRLMGWEGMALVRAGEVIDSFLTALN